LLEDELVDRNNNYATRDAELGPKLYEFVIDNGMGVGNEYFEPAASAANTMGVTLTREFWLYMLRKYHYILPTF
jgi:hypothetical protein